MRDTANPELTAAWATVPEVAEAQTRYEELAKLRKNQPARPGADAARAAVESEAWETFRDTGKWPSDVGKRAAKAYLDGLEHEAASRALYAAEQRAQYEAEGLRDARSDVVLAHLGRRLAETLTDAAEHGEALNGVSDAEGAIQAGGAVLDAWRALTALVPVYGRLRAAQWDVLRSVSGEDDRATLAKWRREGYGQLRGVNPQDIPSDVLSAIQADAYSVPVLVWVANHGDAYMPESFGDVEDDVLTTTADEVSDSPAVEYMTYESRR
ncbi:hypothetical protein [Streptomyces sp. PLM4]|uniref:hypothetical protein n=1 Tax=Streptomyces sp. PLM4 TaxID=2929798 RepID=UPI0020646894|nr:hypothetical protein [Streptomyces sp. PLM4]BDH67016.1 hypothetical protein MTP06_04650 [Streptomyces sp. PLM4]